MGDRRSTRTRPQGRAFEGAFVCFARHLRGLETGGAGFQALGRRFCSLSFEKKSCLQDRQRTARRRGCSGKRRVSGFDANCTPLAVAIGAALPASLGEAGAKGR